jgi:hypothetical protein
MKRFVPIPIFLILVAVSVGCGTGRAADIWGKTDTRFVNQGVVGQQGRAGLSDADFKRVMEERWLMAQNEIAANAQFDLTGVKISDPDVRALSVLPSNVVVIGNVEVPADEVNPST